MECFLGQLQLFAFNFVPTGWLPCEGQLLAINQYQALYALLGIRYGGNGTTTFGLPDLRGRAPLCTDQLPSSAKYPLGQNGGQETVVLAANQVPPHNHGIAVVTTAASSGRPANNLLADTSSDTLKMYVSPMGQNPATLNAAAMSAAGGQAHENRQPYIALTWAIAITGIWPTRD